MPTVVNAIMFSSTNPLLGDVIQLILLSPAKVEQMKQCKAHKKVDVAYEERKFIKKAATKALAKKKVHLQGRWFRNGKQEEHYQKQPQLMNGFLIIIFLIRCCYMHLYAEYYFAFKNYD